MTPAFDQLREHLSAVRIAHHMRGRIRLALKADLVSLSLHRQPITQLQALAERIPGLLSVRVNVLARSCALEYDPAVIPDQAWSDFLAGTKSPAATVLEQILRDTYQEIIHAKL